MVFSEFDPHPGSANPPSAQNPSVAARLTGPRKQHEVTIAAYAQMGNDEIELSGSIGQQLFAATSRSKAHSIRVDGSVGGEAIELKISRRRIRALPVKGFVVGQRVTGSLSFSRGTAIFDGNAGQESLRYLFDPLGTCSNYSTDLGLRIVYQAFYSEVVGSADRTADAAMIALLLPAILQKRQSS